MDTHTDTPLLSLTRPGGSVMMPNLLVPRFDSNSWVLSDRQVPREKKNPQIGHQKWFRRDARSMPKGVWRDIRFGYSVFFFMLHV